MEDTKEKNYKEVQFYMRKADYNRIEEERKIIGVSQNSMITWILLNGYGKYRKEKNILAKYTYSKKDEDKLIHIRLTNNLHERFASISEEYGMALKNTIAVFFRMSCENYPKKHFVKEQNVGVNKTKKRKLTSLSISIYVYTYLKHVSTVLNINISDLVAIMVYEYMRNGVL